MRQQPKQMISQKELEKFKAIYKKKTGIDLPDQDALEKATKLFTLVKAIYKPMTKEEYDMVQKRREETRNH
jgi:hypothetical protein